jgi:hypothetical protein
MAGMGMGIGIGIGIGMGRKEVNVLLATVWVGVVSGSEPKRSSSSWSVGEFIFGREEGMERVCRIKG